MNKVETEVLSQSLFKPLIWKRYTDNIVSLWTTNYKQRQIEHFIEQANNHHPTIKFMLKFLIRKQHSWPPTSTKAKDSKVTQSLMWVLILNQLRHFSIPILVPVTRKELKKASLKGRPPDFSEQLFQNNIRRENYKFQSASATEVTQRISLTQPSQRWIS